MESLKIENSLLDIERSLEELKDPKLRAEATLRKLADEYQKCAMLNSCEDYESPSFDWTEIDRTSEMATAIVILEHYLKHGSFEGYIPLSRNAEFIPMKNRLIALINKYEGEIRVTAVINLN